MKEKEKDAFELLENDKNYNRDSFYRMTIGDKYTRSFKTILDLIEKQQDELEKKDKMIDLMLEVIKSTKIGISTEKGIECWNKGEWKKYFEKQVEKE